MCYIINASEDARVLMPWKDGFFIEATESSRSVSSDPVHSLCENSFDCLNNVQITSF